MIPGCGGTNARIGKENIFGDTIGCQTSFWHVGRKVSKSVGSGRALGSWKLHQFLLLACPPVTWPQPHLLLLPCRCPWGTAVQMHLNPSSFQLDTKPGKGEVWLFDGGQFLCQQPCQRTLQKSACNLFVHWNRAPLSTFVKQILSWGPGVFFSCHPCSSLLAFL